MSNIERFWDTIIEEAAGKGAPPDLSREILAQLDTPAARNPRRGRTILLRAAQFATAAAALFAIAWLTGLVRFDGGAGGTGIPACGDAGDPKVYAASPGAEVFERDGVVELKRGWLLVTTGAPDVVSGDSKLTDVDGRVLVHAPRPPTNEQIESATPWLNANRLETDMIKQMKAWATGTTLAALVLSGSAILDGQEIKAQDEEATEEPVWHLVSSVMDIEKLPEDATHIRAFQLQGAHIEFLAERARVTVLSLRGCRRFRPEHLEPLSRMTDLRELDLRGINWDHEVDYGNLQSLTFLDTLSVDYVPYVSGRSSNEFPEDWVKEFRVLESLQVLSKDHGVEIELDELDKVGGRQLIDIVNGIPTLKGIKVQNKTRHITDADIKHVAAHPRLETLDITGCYKVGELGLAYIAKHNRLKRLAIKMELTSPVRFQLSKMTSLEAFRIAKLSRYDADDGYEQAKSLAVTLGAIADLPKLSQLQLPRGLPPETFEGIREFANIDHLQLYFGRSFEYPYNGVTDLEPAAASGVRRLSIDTYLDDLVEGADDLNEDYRQKLYDMSFEDSSGSLEELTLRVETWSDTAHFPESAENPVIPEVIGRVGSVKSIKVEFYYDRSMLEDEDRFRRESAGFIGKHFDSYNVEIDYKPQG